MSDTISGEARGLRLGIEDRAIWFHLLLAAAEKQGADPGLVARDALVEFGRRAGSAAGPFAAPADFARAMARGPGKDAFDCSILCQEDDLAVLRLGYCPLVAAWKRYGLSPARIAYLCRLTQYGDRGRLDGSPLRLEFAALISEGAPACQIRIMRRIGEG